MKTSHGSASAFLALFLLLAVVAGQAQGVPFELYVAGNNTISQLDTDGNVVATAPTDNGGRGMGILGDVFYTAFQGGSHRQGVTTVDYPWPPSPTYETEFMTLDADPTRIYDDPRDMAVGPDDALYIVSTNMAKGVVRYDPASGALSQFIDGSDWDTAWYLAVGPDANGNGQSDFYVGNWATDINEIRIYDGANGAYIRNLVDTATNGGLNRPHGMAFQTEGGHPYLYVASMLNDRVKKYDGVTGAFIEDYYRASWVKPGETATFRTYGLTFDDAGYMYVGTNNGIYRVDPGGGTASGEHFSSVGKDHMMFVPEPASLAVLVLGGLAVLRRRR